MLVKWLYEQIDTFCSELHDGHFVVPSHMIPQQGVLCVGAVDESELSEVHDIVPAQLPEALLQHQSLAGLDGSEHRGNGGILVMKYMHGRWFACLLTSRGFIGHCTC